jgi:2',5'-phosphodiesterase
MVKMQVATYNVLSSALCDTAYYPHVDAKHCASSHRYICLLSKLDALVNLDVTICLQEVSMEWAGLLHAYFDSRGYTFIVSNYETRSNGFMGVGIAFSRDSFKLISSKMVVVGDTKVGGWKAPHASPPSKMGLTASFLMNGLRSFVTEMKRIWLGVDDTRRRTTWDLAKNRSNVMVSVVLRPKKMDVGTLDVMVATYHMPCQFWDPAVMTIHTAICFQELQRQAGSMPYVLAGDFNFKPQSPMYKLITGWGLDPVVNDPEDEEVHGKSTIPSRVLYPGDPFNYNFQAMASVYDPKRHPFSCYAQTKDAKNPFFGMLDHIFYHSGARTKLNLIETIDLTATCEDATETSLPSETQGSDHLLFWARFITATK